MEKLLASFILFILCSSLSIAQNNFNDIFNVTQVNQPFAGFNMTTYQGLNAGGHPYFWMRNKGGIATNVTATPGNTILGSLIFSGRDGVNNAEAQVARVLVKTTDQFDDGYYPVNMEFRVGATTTCCGTTRMTINGQTGNVGIGTTNTDDDYRLAVGGKIISEEVRVLLQASWPDYVFTRDYELPSLQEVETYIQENGHLENIPSAIDVEKNGITLGEMNAKLLEKIEELTLYSIDQEKKIENQQKEINQIKLNLQQLIKLSKKP